MAYRNRFKLGISVIAKGVEAVAGAYGGKR